jgi:mRNA-degrading endonuclease toxin of MazEF toxin-antitoxin module
MAGQLLITDSGRGTFLSTTGARTSGLAKESFALIDHLRSIDKRRIRRVFGELTREEIEAVDEGLTVFLGLGDRFESR